MKKEASQNNNVQLDNKIKNAQNNITKFKSLVVRTIKKKKKKILILIYEY